MPRISMHRAGTCHWPLWTGGLLLFWCLLVTLWSNPVGAETARVVIFISDSGGAYDDVTTALRTRLNALAPNAVQLQIINIAQGNGALDDALQPPPDLIVSVGTQTSVYAQHRSGNIPVLSLLVSARGYSLLSQSPSSDLGLRSAIYLDQPLNRQLDLLQLALPKATRLASLNGPQSAALVQELRTLCLQRGLQLSTEFVAHDSNPIRPLTQLIDSAEVLLALPDPDVFNRTSIQSILLTTYRNNVPVIGFSQAYVRAGALAAVHSTANQIGRQAGEWIAELVNTDNWQLGTPRYPRYYSVAVNAQVAQSLGISLSNENVLHNQLQQLENKSP